MKAEEFEVLINETLDRRIVPGDDPRLRQLAMGSDDLRAILGSYTLLCEGVKKLEVPRPSPELDARILEAARQPSNEPTILPIASGRSKRWLLGAAAAAAVILMPLLYWSQLRSEAPGGAALAAKAPVVVNQLPAPQATNAANPLVTEAAPNNPNDRQSTASEPPKMARYAALARQTTGVVADFTMLVSEISADPRGFADRAKQRSEGKNVVEQVSEGLEPLANSAAGAFDFLLSVLPEIDPKRS